MSSAIFQNSWHNKIICITSINIQWGYKSNIGAVTKTLLFKLAEKYTFFFAEKYTFFDFSAFSFYNIIIYNFACFLDKLFTGRMVKRPVCKYYHNISFTVWRINNSGIAKHCSDITGFVNK